MVSTFHLALQILYLFLITQMKVLQTPKHEVRYQIYHTGKYLHYINKSLNIHKFITSERSERSS